MIEEIEHQLCMQLHGKWFIVQSRNPEEVTRNTSYQKTQKREGDSQSHPQKALV